MKKIKLSRPIYFVANDYIDLNGYQPLCAVLTDLIIISELNMRQVRGSSLFHRRGNQGTERLSDLSKITQPERGSTRR